MTDRIDLDCNAAAPLLPEAREALLEWLDCANPSSVHADGRRARAAIEAARAAITGAIGAPGAEVVFTSGATEAANLVLTPNYLMGRSPLRYERLLVADTEHACVRDGGRFAPEAVERLPVDRNGRVRRDALAEALARSGDPAIVAIMLANNESGVVQDIAALAAIVHRHGGILVCDAVQALGRIPIDMEALSADFLLLSSRKIGGAYGAGALVARGPMLMPEPILRGGGQERGHRSGTENVAAIASLGAAVASVREGAQMDRLRRLRDRFEREAVRVAPSITIHAVGAERLPNTTLFSFAELKAETAQIAFDLDGIAVSNGSACSSGKVGASHVLTAMGIDAPGAVRISLSRATTDEHIDRALATLRRLGERDAAKLELLPKAA